MSPPVFLLAPAELAGVQPGAVLPVSGTEGRHGAAALRLRPDEPVELVDGAGRRASARVVAVARDGFTAAVAQISDEPSPNPRITVVQALAKGDRGESAVEMMTEAGVDRIVPWSASRSIAVWQGDRAERGLRRWRAVAAAAGKQSRRARHPAVAPLADTDGVAALIAEARLALVLHESAVARLAQLDLPTAGEIVVVVGPEGGIADDELDRFAAAGALPVRLGSSVLRTSTAGVAALSVVMARSGRWD